MAIFKSFLFLLKSIEGGYLSASMAASIDDSGGETYKGVARNYHPNWAGWAIVDAWKAKNGGSLPWKYIIPDRTLDALVDSFYKNEFWDYFSADKIKNQSLANLVVDFGVNSGEKTAAMQVQKALGLAVDGIVGKDTLAALNRAPMEAFNRIKERRREFIQTSGKIKPTVKEILIRDRVDAFFFRDEEK